MTTKTNMQQVAPFPAVLAWWCCVFLSPKDMARLLFVHKAALVYLIQPCLQHYANLLTKINNNYHSNLAEQDCAQVLQVLLHDAPSLHTMLYVCVNIEYIHHLVGQLQDRSSCAAHYQQLHKQLLMLPRLFARADYEQRPKMVLYTKRQMQTLGLVCFLEQVARCPQYAKYLAILISQVPSLCLLVLYRQHYITWEEKFADYGMFDQARIAARVGWHELLGNDEVELLCSSEALRCVSGALVKLHHNLPHFMQLLASKPRLAQLLLLQLSTLLLFYAGQLRSIVSGLNPVCSLREFRAAVAGRHELALVLLSYSWQLSILCGGAHPICSFREFMADIAGNCQMAVVLLCGQSQLRALIDNNDPVCSLSEFLDLVAGNYRLAKVLLSYAQQVRSVVNSPTALWSLWDIMRAVNGSPELLPQVLAQLSERTNYAVWPKL